MIGPLRRRSASSRGAASPGSSTRPTTPAATHRAGSSRSGQLSLHAWGVAIDINAAANPFMGRSRQDPRLVRTMQRHGFTWGGEWPTRPDPMHFELRNLPRP